MIDFEKWYVSGLPLPLIAACAACQKGVKRAHLVDARLDGALLLELYSRDGVGTMLSADFYEVSVLLSLPAAVFECLCWANAIPGMVCRVLDVWLADIEQNVHD